SMNIQYSRGCPYNCEFCDIVVLNGNRPRTKVEKQILAELESLYQYGWRGSVFVVDDNFIGKKQKLKEGILPAIIDWMQKRRYPFTLLTETSINLADDEELIRLMVDAGFDTVFIGLESPNEESLAECNKSQNKKRDLIAAVKKIQNYGLQVQGGFIVGFDSDPPSIFKNQISFIQNSGIVTAMVGLLNAPRGTRLYKRLQKEQRLLDGFSGDNMDCSINFIPRMKYETLINGYKYILKTIYAPKQYYERIRMCLMEYRPKKKKGALLKLRTYHLTAFMKSIWILGIWGKGKKYYWKLMLSTLFQHPHLLPLAVSLSVYGFHFRKIVEKCARLPITNALETGKGSRI
ncbi:MAG: B12-binding domain-containing radical SAM protein, partial [Dehalococcoidia bacterium]